MLRWYRDGTVNLTQGSAAVVGVNTLWRLALNPGDMLTLDDGGSFYEIHSIEDNTHLTLARVYGGTTLTGQSYAVARLFGATDYSKVALQVTNLMNTWQARDDEFTAWVQGSVSGGPNSDGRYPVRDAQGTQHLLYSPAYLSQTYAQVAADFVTLAGYRDTALSARDTALSARDAASASETSASDSAATASGYADAAQASAVTATTGAATATTKADAAAASAATATSEADRATQAANTATNAAGGETTNIPNALVKRDANGDFSAGTITASLTGTASGNVPLSERLTDRERFLSKLASTSKTPAFDAVTGDLTSVTYGTGEKAIFGYTGGNLATIRYYADATLAALLYTKTLTYDTAGIWAGSAWS